MSIAIACFKWVLDEQDIVVNSDMSVSYARAKRILSGYDRNAIEAAAQIAEGTGGKAFGLTFAPDVPKQLVKDALSRRLDELVYVKDAAAQSANPQTTALALANAIKQIDDVGVIICAEGSQDAFARQIPCRIAALLDLPLITSVSSYEVADGAVVATRRLEDRMQTVKASLPAVIAILPEANTVPIPGMKAVLAAGKKPVKELSLADIGVQAPAPAAIEQKGFVAHRKGVRIDGSPEEMAAQLKDALLKEGVI